VDGEEEATYADFASIWARAELVPGWLTQAQARELWDAAHALPPGSLVVEIGSHQGRSTLVLAAAVQGRAGQLVAVDPFIEGRLFGGSSTRALFEANVTGSGLAGVVTLQPVRSTELRPSWTAPVALVYIDGKHDYWTVSDDLRWLDLLPAGGIALVHDAFSSVGVTLALLRHVLISPDVTYVRRTASLAVLQRNRPGTSGRLRLVAQLPWFARNLAIKIALRAARLVGQHPTDPY
jgi:predicted O-methyltransferase YrrM